MIVEHYKYPAFDIIYHLASYGVDYRQQDLAKMTEVNVLLTSKLLVFAKLNATLRFVNVGTAFEYGTNDSRPLREFDADAPQGLYAATKNAATKIATAYAKLNVIPLINLRLFGVFGPGEGLHKIVPMIMKAGINSEPIDLTKGEQIRDYLYIKDIIDAFIKICEDNDMVFYETYNICSGKPTSIREFSEKIIEACGFDKELYHFGKLEYRKNEVMYFVGDNTKIMAKCNWQPNYNIDKAIKETLDYYMRLLKEETI